MSVSAIDLNYLQGVQANIQDWASETDDETVADL